MATSDLSSEQQKVVAHIRSRARRKRASPKQVKAAIETGLVEANLTNPEGGDADSEGWRQERRSIYKNPQDLDASIDRFFDETAAVKNKYSRAGDLAAAVQRPRADLRGKYQQRSGDAERILSGSKSGGKPARAAGTTTTTRDVEGFDEAGYEAATKKQALAQLLSRRHGSKGSVLLRTGAISTAPVDKEQYTTTKQVTDTKTTPSSSAPDASGGGGFASALKQRAETIDAKHLPYKWGGGHGGKVDPATAAPLDCSGAVSAVLGINPKVSGQFRNFGSPGDGGNKGVTIAANDHHVLMKINGHWFGTSGTNPQGGAGWIPQSAISPEYLRGFTLRHSKR